MRVVLVNPPSLCVEDDRREPPLGLLYVAAAARHAGFRDVSVCDMSGCKTEEEARRAIETVPAAEVYGVSCMCTNHEYARRVVSRIRASNRSAYVVMGGPNPSALPELTLGGIAADAVVVGEGEDAFARCLKSYRSGDRLTGVVAGTPRDDVNGYPFPARDLVDDETYSRRLLGEPAVSLLSSRGCPHRCAFCNSVVMGGGARRARYRSADNVTEEVRRLRETRRNFRFNDDCFTANPRLPALLERLARMDIVLRVFARVDDLTPANCRALRAAGCVHVAVGLESLNPDNLGILGKARQVGKQGNVRVAREAGLVVRAFFMVGLPYDTDASIEKYSAEAAALGIDEFAVYPLIPYPGTRIARDPGRFGYTIVNRDFRDYVQIGAGAKTCFALRHRNFTPADVQRWQRRVGEILVAGGATPSNRSAVAT